MESPRDAMESGYPSVMPDAPFGLGGASSAVSATSASRTTRAYRNYAHSRGPPFAVAPSYAPRRRCDYVQLS